ncbi:MAG: hypothetical protein AAGJ46_20405 [Planctomycetota bacterium]
MNTRLAALLLTVGHAYSVTLGAQAAKGCDDAEGSLHETRVVAKLNPLVAESHYKLWLPEGASTIRVIFAINMRAAGRRLFFEDREWRAMAARNGAAMLYCEFEARSVRDNGYGQSMLSACEQFASALDRPELETAPFVLWGHSMGGRVTQDFVRFMPSRVVTFHIALRGHPSSKPFMEEEEVAQSVPGLYLMGAKDGRPKDIREHFESARKRQSPRAWVWLPGQSHWPKGMSFDQDATTPADWRAWSANEVVIPWTEAMIRLRLPKETPPAGETIELLPIDMTRGWLGNPETGHVAPYSAYSGTKPQASWFPSKEGAEAWTSYAFGGRR